MTFGIWNIISVMFLKSLLAMCINVLSIQELLYILGVTIQAAAIYLIHLIRINGSICGVSVKR